MKTEKAVTSKGFITKTNFLLRNSSGPVKEAAKFQSYFEQGNTFFLDEFNFFFELIAAAGDVCMNPVGMELNFMFEQRSKCDLLLDYTE